MQSGHGRVTLYGRAFVLCYMFVSANLVRSAYCFLCCVSVFIAILQPGTFSLARTMLPWFLTLACHVTCTKVGNTKAQAGQVKNRLPLVSTVSLKFLLFAFQLIIQFTFYSRFLTHFCRVFIQGMLPVRWMAPESLEDYTYNTKTDV